MRSLGKQIVAEFYGCERSRLDDVGFIEQAMTDAAQIAGATIVSRAFHHFSPHGVSGAVIIAESHLAVHTWPEHGYAAVDLFTCGDDILAAAAFDHLRAMLAAGQISTMEIHRGQVDMMREKSGEEQQAQLSLVK